MNKMLTRLTQNRVLLCADVLNSTRRCSRQAMSRDDEFRVFDVKSRKRKEVTTDVTYIKPPPPPARELQMPVDQDWSNVWPGPKTFHPASVPLPLKQGHDYNNKLTPPGKYANTELMKLPNFLHLTPPAIKKHCNALRKFCTPWPTNLVDDKTIDRHFPLQVISTDYCHSSPKIRDPKARVVTFQFKLSHLSLDSHSKDKIRRLLGTRINDENDVVTLVADRCPLRKQNYDYNQYLLLALFYESWKVENWESEKVEEDMESYDWSRNRSRQALIALKKWSTRGNDASDNTSENNTELAELMNKDGAEEYRDAVSDLFNKGETIQNLFKYKEAVLKIVL